MAAIADLLGQDDVTKLAALRVDLGRHESRAAAAQGRQAVSPPAAPLEHDAPGQAAAVPPAVFRSEAGQ